MVNINPGSEEFEGNFSYLPVESEDEIIGYYMVAYGSYNNPGMDINEDWTNDHVILVLKGFRDGFESTPELLIEIFNQYLEISEESP